jgi:predicted S18 family serine protease
MSTINQGTAKAWVNFTGITTTAERDSFNISSLTDTGTAKTTVAYTNNMGNANYTGSYFQNGSTARTITSFDNHYTGGFGDRTTSSCGVHSYVGTSSGDVSDNDLLILGDLA